MNAAAPLFTEPVAMADLATLALAAVAAQLGTGDFQADMLPACVETLRAAPAGDDHRLVRVADALGLTDAELLTVALCLAVERDALAARALADAQHPLGGSRLLIGFAATALGSLGANSVGIGCGAAVAAGLLVLGDEAAALPERSIHLPEALVAALSGIARDLPGVRTITTPAVPLPAATVAEARRRAALIAQQPGTGLVLRSPSEPEAIAVAAEVAAALGKSLARIDAVPPPGLAPWLIATAAVPLFTAHPAPGDRWPRPPLSFYAGPWLVACGPEGAIDADAPPDEWLLPVPGEAARAQLWATAGLADSDAQLAAASFRQGAGRIAEVAARARLAAARSGGPIAWSHVAEAMTGSAGTLDAHARRSPGTVTDAALVAPPGLKAALAELVERAQVRASLADGLGPALTARYRPGVRALMVGPPGTGKTLAAHWLATRLGLPLYRVDLAALTSKYIGETEKNLSALFAAAEHADVVLFFDEADALFAARTGVSDSNDRFANAQTNYLLQRIEEHDGIVLLASNSRERFDPAFVRRLDAILDFPSPEAAARRDLWLAHLGDGHDLTEQHLDRMAVAIDLSGGHIRNIVLAAAARARGAGRGLGWDDIAQGVVREYAKLGRTPPELGG